MWLTLSISQNFPQPHVSSSIPKILSEPSIDLHGVAASRQVVKRRRSISVFSSQIHLLLLLKEGRRDGVSKSLENAICSPLTSLKALGGKGTFFCQRHALFPDAFCRPTKSCSASYSRGTASTRWPDAFWDIDHRGNLLTYLHFT